MNIIWNAQGCKTGIFVGLGETKYLGLINGGRTGKKYPLYISLSGRLFKKGSFILETLKYSSS